MKSFIKLFFALILILGFAGHASAHATPISYEPTSGSVLEHSPDHVSIRFSERIENSASGIEVYGPDGSSVVRGLAEVSRDDPRSFAVEMSGKDDGAYTVSWQVVSSDDGHFTKGAFTFFVGKGAAGAEVPASQIQIQHITTVPQAGTIGIELVGQALMLGVLFFLAFLWRPLKKRFSGEISFLIGKAETRFSILFVLGAVLIFIGAILFIILKTFDLQQLRPGDFSATLRTFLGTVDGSHAFVRGLFGLLSIPLFIFFRKYIFKNEKTTWVEILLISMLTLMLLSRARVSHAAASHFYPMFSILVNAFQLLFKELWIGGILVFSAAILPFLLRLKNKLSFARLSTELSKYMSIALAGIGVTGTYIVWLHLKDPSYLFSTEWGSGFIVLSLFGGALLLVRMYNQFFVDRSLLKYSIQIDDKKLPGAITWSMASFFLEALIGLALLFVTSLMIITTPPYSTERFTFERTTESNGAEIHMTVHPSESSEFLVTVEDAENHSEIPVSNMVITVTNTEKGLGPIVVDTEERFPGGYVFPESLLSPAGNWTISISASRPESYDAVASFKISYPDQVVLSRIDPDKRHMGLFEIVLIFSALFIILLSCFLYRFSQKLYISCLKGNERDEFKNEDNKYLPSSLISFILAFLGFIAVCTAIWYIHSNFIKTDFQKLCEKNGHFWLQSIPMRDGVALSPDTVTGCFLDVGLYHFADQREYEFFYKRREIVPEISYSPSTLTAGIPSNMILSLTEIKDGEKTGPVTELGINHDRILHVLIVGEDLKTFAHIHSEDLGPITEEMKKNASFPLNYTFPKAGHYALNIDFIASGIEYTDVIIVNVLGEPKMEAPIYNPDPAENNIPVTKDFEGYDVTFSAPKVIKAGEKLSLKYHIEKDGKPINDLEPYLGAAMHLGLVRYDLGRFFHTHGEASLPGSVWFQQLFGKYFKYHMHFAPDQFGPDIITPPWATKFTTPGTYTVFGEFKAEGKIIVTDFQVNVK